MKRELWLRLKNYHFDNLVPPQLWDHVRSAFGGTSPGTHAFASKVARKLKWDHTFALRTVREYRKYVYLGIVADFHVTPPRFIDQVWHEHLLFSRAYREFCRDVLQHDFDHNPELLPYDEQTGLFQAQYEATLELYFVEFNVRPPSDIWGMTKFRKGSVESEPDLPRKRSDDVAMAFLYNDAPLHQHFDSDSSSGDSYQSMSEFGGSGESSSGGGGESYGDSSSSSDSGSSDSGGDSGGSSCSSGCSSGCSGGD